MENEEQSNTSPIQPLFTTSTPLSATPTTLKILSFVVLGLALISGSVFVGIQIGKSQASNQISANTQPTITLNPIETQPSDQLSPSPAVDPTANWKTYTSRNFGVSFKYPSNWKLTESEESDDPIWYDRTIFQLISPDITSFDHGIIVGGYYIAFSVSKPNPNYSNLQEFLDYERDQYNYSYVAKKINNIDGYIISVNDKETLYVFSRDKLIFTIDLLSDKDTQTLDQILSTFKFTK